MKKLARNWRYSRDDKYSLPTRDADDHRPIDSNQQEELVRSLEREQAAQSFLWRRVFAALVFCYAAFLFYSIYQQALSPWELRYHAYFMEDMDSWMVISEVSLVLILLKALLASIFSFLFNKILFWPFSVYWVAVSACALDVVGLLHNSKNKRQWIWYSFSAGLALAIFWLYYMLRMPRFGWDVIWLPFGPLSCDW